MAKVKKYKKIAYGFVVQEFEKQGKKFVCTNQTFEASNEVDYEDNNGNVLDMDDLNENEEGYFPFNMVQPE
jgi:hypothetical protein